MFCLSKFSSSLSTHHAKNFGTADDENLANHHPDLDFPTWSNYHYQNHKTPCLSYTVLNNQCHHTFQMLLCCDQGHALVQLVEALCCKLEGRRYDSQWCHWTFLLTYSGHTVALRQTQPLTEMSTRNIAWGVKVVSAQGWQPYHLHVLNVMKYGSLNLLEPSRHVQGLFYLFYLLLCCHLNR